MSDVILYPRGFTSVVTEDMTPNFSEVIRSDGDAELMALYTDYMNQSVNIDGWSFQGRVIRKAAELFGNLPRWLAFQAIGNDYLYDINYAYLKDTIQYLRTGKRDMSVVTWRDITLDDVGNRPGEASKKRYIDSFGATDDLAYNPLGLWCSKPDGFADLMVSLYVFFGERKSTLVRKTETSYGRHMSSSHY